MQQGKIHSLTSNQRLLGVQRDRKTWAIIRIMNHLKPRIDTDVKLVEKSIKVVIIIAFYMFKQLCGDTEDIKKAQIELLDTKITCEMKNTLDGMTD